MPTRSTLPRAHGSLVKRRLVPAVIGMAAIIALTTGPASAKAASLHNSEAAGDESAISCISTSLCFGVGANSKAVGDIVAIKGGKPGSTVTVHGTESVPSISCPSRSGCIATAIPSDGVGAEIVDVSNKGKATKTFEPKLPSGYQLGVIGCSSLKSCVLGGSDVLTSPNDELVGFWNGKKLTTEKFKGPKNASSASIHGVGCSKSGCVAVGYASVGVKVESVVIDVHHGKASAPRTIPKASLYAVSCASSSRCYADGFATSGGLIVPINNGKPQSPVHNAAALYGIACHGADCTAVGYQIPPDAGPTQGDAGAIVPLKSGKPGATTFVTASARFTSVSQPAGNFFAAIGDSLSSKRPTEVTTN